MDQEQRGQTNDILRRVALALERLAPNQQTTQSAIDALLKIGITDSGKKSDDSSKGSGSSGGGRGSGGGRDDSGEDGGSGGGKGPPKPPDQSATGMLKGLGPSASRLLGAGESLLPGLGLGEIGSTISKMVNLLSAFEGAKDALGRMGFLGDASQTLGPPGLPPPLPPDVRTLPLSPDGPEKAEPGLLPPGTPLGKLPAAIVPGTEHDEKLDPDGPTPSLLPIGAGTPRGKKPTLLDRDATVDPLPSLIPLDQQEGIPGLLPVGKGSPSLPASPPDDGEVPALKSLAPRTQLAPSVYHDAAGQGGDDVPMLKPQAPESGMDPAPVPVGGAGGPDTEGGLVPDGQGDGAAQAQVSRQTAAMEAVERNTRPKVESQVKDKNQFNKPQSQEASGAQSAQKDRGDMYGATIGKVEDKLAKVAEVAFKVI